MKHCCEFDAFDVWYLKDNEDFCNRTLFIGNCPICKKHVAELEQKNSKTHTNVKIKKCGEAATKFIVSLLSDKVSSLRNINKMKFTSKPFGWRYGVNRQIVDKSGNKTVEQYAMDFFGNSELIKKI